MGFLKRVSKDQFFWASRPRFGRQDQGSHVKSGIGVERRRWGVARWSPSLAPKNNYIETLNPNPHAMVRFRVPDLLWTVPDLHCPTLRGLRCEICDNAAICARALGKSGFALPGTRVFEFCALSNFDLAGFATTRKFALAP